MNSHAILSVFDKSDLLPFAIELAKRGVTILSTGGTSRHLKEGGVEVVSISDYTGSPEILDGRVKSLHPKIHGGILARRSLDKDNQTLEEHDIAPIDFVVVNLYPFLDKVNEVVSSKDPNHPSLVEDIDIGGPTMIRAAAKNCHHVVPVCDPADYPLILKELDESGEISLSLRRKLAAKVFSMMANYDSQIARYFSLDEKLLDEEGNSKGLAPREAIVLKEKQQLRYGENPHQSARLYELVGGDNKSLWTQTQGKELSYNNLVDMQATLDVFTELYDGLGDKNVAVVIKHTNPCGAAIRDKAIDAFKAARDCDPISAFGGIIAVSGTVDVELAKTITENFVEIVCVEELTDEARAVFAKKKNLRLIACDYSSMLAAAKEKQFTVKSVGADFLIQEGDSNCAKITKESEQTGADISSETLDDLNFAWKVAKHVKSNTIVVAKDGQAIGVGAGQMSRVDAARIALDRAKAHGFSPEGAVAASDAFLPFADTLEVLNDGGVVSLAQPGGSKKDDVVIEAAKSRGMSMVFTSERHFRH